MIKSVFNFVMAAFAASLLFSSCVDKTYDLSEGVDTDNLVLGSGGFIVPLGDIEIDISKFIDDLTPSLLQAKGAETCTFSDYNDNLAIDAGFDDGIIDMLTEYGDMTLRAKISNVGLFGFNLKIKVSFAESANDEGVVVIDEQNLITSTGSVEIQTNTLNKNVLKKIAVSKFIKLNIATSSGRQETFMYNLDSAQSMKIHLSIKKTGGIKL